MVGVTKDELVDRLGRIEVVLGCQPACSTSGAYRLARDLLSDIRDIGLDPGPHPAEAEAEKLRAEKDSLLQQASVAEEQAERLRAELADLLGRNGEQAKALDVAKREIAALQDRNGRQYETIKVRDTTIEARDAEIRRLKGEAATTETANRAYSAAVQAYRKTVAELESQVRDLKSRAECAPDTLVRGQAKAWRAAIDAISDVEPTWYRRPGTGMDAACSVVRELAAARDERDALKAQNAQLLRAVEDRSAKIGTPAGDRLARMMDFAAECSGAGHGSRIARLEAERDALKAEVERLNSVSRVSSVFRTPEIGNLRGAARRIIAGLDEIDRKIEAINAGN